MRMFKLLSFSSVLLIAMSCSPNPSSQVASDKAEARRSNSASAGFKLSDSFISEDLLPDQTCREGWIKKNGKCVYEKIIQIQFNMEPILSPDVLANKDSNSISKLKESFCDFLSASFDDELYNCTSKKTFKDFSNSSPEAAAILCKNQDPCHLDLSSFLPATTDLSDLNIHGVDSIIFSAPVNEAFCKQLPKGWTYKKDACVFHMTSITIYKSQDLLHVACMLRGPYWQWDGTSCGILDDKYQSYLQENYAGIDVFGLKDAVGSNTKAPTEKPQIKSADDIFLIEKAVMDTSKEYRFRTQMLEKDHCLEGNARSSPTHDGYAFLDTCQDVCGQFWKFTPADGGYYRLSTTCGPSESVRSGKNVTTTKCLEGADPKEASFLDDCQDVCGQFWSLRQTNNGYYYLTNQCLEETKQCIEGNEPSSSQHHGAIFIDQCKIDAPGQLWKVTPSP